MLHITFVAFIYLTCGSLYLLNAFNLIPIPPKPPPLVTTNLISFMTSLFVFELKLT